MLLYRTCAEIASIASLGNIDGESCFVTLPNCKYCVGQGMSQQSDCSMDQPYGSYESQMCSGARADAPRTRFRPDADTAYPQYPTVEISYPPGSTDAEGNSQPEIVGQQLDPTGNHFVDGSWSYYLASTPMLFDPCAANPQNCTASSPPTWICRLYQVGGEGDAWKMFCTQPITGPGPGDAQLVPRPFDVDVHTHTREPLYLRWYIGLPGACFGFQDQYCFTWECAGDVTWSCIGNYHSDYDIVPAIDWLYIDLTGIRLNDTDIRPGQAFPHPNPEDIHIKNDALRTMADIVTTLGSEDAPAHYRQNKWHSRGLYRWGARWQFGVGEPAVFPVVKDASGDPVVLTATEWRSKVTLPARLTLDSVLMTLHAHVEARYSPVPSDDRRRVYRTHGSFELNLELRVRLEPQAYALAAEGGLEFVDPANPFDLRLIDRQTREPHAQRKLLVSGPGGCAVPRKIRWDGLQARHPYSRGSDAWREVCDMYPGGQCCAALQMLNSTVMFGRLNDHSEVVDSAGRVTPKPQRYLGAVTVEVPRLVDVGEVFFCRCRG